MPLCPGATEAQSETNKPRGWIENQITIELGGSEMRAQHERFFTETVARAAPPSG